MTATYQRVIPRDLFNEANLLKCLGRFWIETERYQPRKVTIEHDGEPFEIWMNDTPCSTDKLALPLRAEKSGSGLLSFFIKTSIKRKPMNKNLGPRDETPCPRCGRRHHQYSWPAKCLEFTERQSHAADLAFDKKAVAKMSKPERDAYRNL